MIFTFIPFIKFGIGRATMTQHKKLETEKLTEEGVALIKQYDGEYPTRFSKEVFEYLTIDKKNFGSITKEFQSPVFDKKYLIN